MDRAPASRLLVAVAAALLAALVLAPLGTMVVASLTIDVVETSGGRTYVGHKLNSDGDGVTLRVAGETTTRSVPRAEVVREAREASLRHYAALFRGPAERDMLLATLALAGASTLLALLLGLPTGLLLAATNLPGRRWFETLLALPLVLPPILLAIATYHDLLGLRPELMRAVAVFGLSLFPLVALFTARAVRASGGDALDAARVATTPREALLRVALGPALPGAAAGALLVFAFVVADFAVPDFLGVTTAKNTIQVYANAVFRSWNNDGDPGAATAAGMPPTVFALLAFGAVLWLERRRGAATAGTDPRPPNPLPLGRARWPLLAALVLLLGAAVLWPAASHLRTAGGAHFGTPVAGGGARTGVAPIDVARAKPDSTLDGLRRGLRHERVDETSKNSLLLSGTAALLAACIALLLAEAGQGRPRLDRLLLVGSFLPVAVPPMSLAVGWMTFWGDGGPGHLWGQALPAQRLGPSLLLAARLLPFATFAVRSVRRRLAPELQDAAALAGLGAPARFVRVTLPLVAPGAALGFVLAFLFGLREVDALVFTRTGSETLPVQLYNMIHYGYDVQVAGLSFLWTAGVGLFLLLAALVGGARFRLVP